MRFISIVILLICPASFAKEFKPDIFFLPCEERASVEFQGLTQAGKDTHRIEVRRLAYRNKNGENNITIWSSVIHYAGDEYGPKIIHTMLDGIAPTVRIIKKDIVEVFYLAGAHTHIRQRWRLTLSGPKLESDEGVEWHENPALLYYQITGESNQPEVKPHINPSDRKNDQYVVKDGDTLFAIGWAFRLTLKELKELNPDMNFESLQAGESLKIAYDPDPLPSFSDK